ncbi:MAG: hypothetical protein R3C99_12350 [Pirellulaceae bacterium]
MDERNFARAVPRRLPAEVVYDAVTQATAADAKVDEMHEQMKGRAIALAASNRNSNQGSAFALSVFGKSIRESNCDCDRSNESNCSKPYSCKNDRDMLSLLDRGDGVASAACPSGIAVAATTPRMLRTAAIYRTRRASCDAVRADA